MNDWSRYNTAEEIFEDTQENRIIDLLGDDALLGYFLHQVHASRPDTHWVLDSIPVYRTLQNTGLTLASEFLRFSANNTETLSLAQNAIKNGAKRLCIHVSESYDGTKFTLLRDLSVLSEENPDCQIVLLRSVQDAELPCPAACRLVLDTEEELFCRVFVARLRKIAGVPVFKRFEQTSEHSPCGSAGSRRWSQNTSWVSFMW